MQQAQRPRTALMMAPPGLPLPGGGGDDSARTPAISPHGQANDTEDRAHNALYVPQPVTNANSGTAQRDIRLRATSEEMFTALVEEMKEAPHAVHVEACSTTVRHLFPAVYHTGTSSF